MKTYIVQINNRNGYAELNDFDDLFLVYAEEDAIDADIIALLREKVDVACFDDDATISITKLDDLQFVGYLSKK